MKVAAIVNNYGQKYDGVGNYAQILLDGFSRDVEKKVYTADCHTANSKVKRILNLGMTRQILRAARDLNRQSDAVILLEYPFTEFNPLTLGAIEALSRVTKKKHMPFIVSLHEFERLNPLARRIAAYLCKKATAILVTTEQTRQEVSKINERVFVRRIPSIIYDDEALSEPIRIDRTRYVFFGTVNKMKAVPELLEAWAKFNEKKDKTLYLLTATQLEDVEARYPGVKYIKGAEPAEVIRVMRQCAFCAVPIRPYVDEKNSSFFTGCLTGCIAIGNMCEEYRRLGFVEHVDSYDAAALLEALKRTEQMSDAEIEAKCSEASAFGRGYSPRQVSETICTFLKEEAARAGQRV